MKETDKSGLTSVILAIGAEMLKYGADVARVEDILNRICKAYGALHVDALSIPAGIVLSVVFEDGKSYTETRRIKGGMTNFYKLDKLNSLARELCRTTPDTEYVKERLNEILSQKSKAQNTVLKNVCAAVFIAGGFSAVFGGGVPEIFLSVLTSLVIIFFELMFKHKNTNLAVYYFVCSFTACLFASSLCKLFTNCNLDIVIISYIMIIIPGLAFVNAAKDLMLGELISGSLKLLESVMYAGFIAAGIVFCLVVTGGMVI